MISTGFTVNQATSVTYQIEGGGLNFTLPAARTETFDPGSYTLTYELEASESGQGWVRLHVTAPSDATSAQITLNLTCQSRDELSPGHQRRSTPLGIGLAGITTPDPLDHFDVYQHWVESGLQAEMGYLASERALLCRARPRKSCQNVS